MERQTVEELRNNISLLEHEKREKAVDRLRYEKEIELLEENWKKESQELLVMITRLQEENKKLSSSLREKDEKIITKSIFSPCTNIFLESISKYLFYLLRSREKRTRLGFV